MLSSSVQRRLFGSTSTLLLKQSRPETIYTFSTSYPRGQPSTRGGGSKRGGGFSKGPSRLKLAPNRDPTEYQDRDNEDSRGSRGNSYKPRGSGFSTRGKNQERVTKL